MAGKIVRYEFLGNAFVFWLMAVFVVTIPFAILYLLGCTVRVDEEMDDPSGFLEQHRAKFG